MTQEEIIQLEDDIFKYGLLQFRKYDEYLISNLICNKITFGSAQNFNDPFDCNLPIDMECSFKDIQNFTIEANFANGNFDLSSIAQKAIELYRKPEMLHNELKDMILNQRRFSCFNLAKAKRHLHNSLFWANYANKHRGVCMKFTGELIKYYHDFFQDLIGLVPVKYTIDDMIPEFNYFKNRKSRDHFAVEYFFGTKSKEWEYEEEIRLIYQPDIKVLNSYINFEFNPNSLDSVYLGCKITSNEEEEILSCLSDRKYDHVDIYKLEMDNRRFKLNDNLIREGKK